MSPKPKKTPAQNRREVSAYIDRFPPQVQSRLKKIRAAIRKAAPKTEERISYGIVGYFQDGVLIYFAGFRNHVSLYPVTPAVRKALGAKLEPYLASKATMRFALDEPLPVAFVTRVVKIRLKEKAK